MNDHVAYELKEPLLSVRDVKKSYGDKRVLGGVNFDIFDVVRSDGVPQGEVWGIIGPSGLGKTTLFRCIAGLEEPTSGQVLLGKKLEPMRVGQVGVVHQNYPLFRWRTVLEELIIAARQRHCRSRAEAKELAEKALAEYGLSDKVHSYPAELSGGQRQRVAIIAQLLSSDGLLLMDEPFTGLDPLAKDIACNAILNASHNDERNTTIVVTHDIASAVQICDTILLLGRKRDEAGNSLGSVIRKTYDLIERGLAWHEGIADRPDFYQMVREIMNDLRIC